jgi:transcriptional regulator NrdR family protein
MTYDDWKLENAEDEAAARIRRRRIPCEDCDKNFATIEVYHKYGDIYLCEACYEKREDDANHDGAELEHDPS